MAAWSAKVVASSICLSEPNRIACQHNNANRQPLPQQRDTKDGTKPPKSLAFFQRVFWINLNVIYLNRFAFGYSTPKHRAAAGDNGSLPHVFMIFAGVTIARHIWVAVSIGAMDGRTVGIAKSSR